MKKSTGTPSWRVISHRILANCFSFRDPNTRTIKNNANLIGQYETCEFSGFFHRERTANNGIASSLFQIMFLFFIFMYNNCLSVHLLLAKERVCM